MITKRIHKEICEIMQTSSTTNISISAMYGDMYHLSGKILGPNNSPYENIWFILDIRVPCEYPFKPPKVQFITQVYHCNIDKNGNICLDMLKDQWSPVLTLEQILTSIVSLLANPNPYDPLVPEIAEQYLNNRKEHDIIAREFNQKTQ